MDSAIHEICQHQKRLTIHPRQVGFSVMRQSMTIYLSGTDNALVLFLQSSGAQIWRVAMGIFSMIP